MTAQASTVDLRPCMLLLLSLLYSTLIDKPAAPAKTKFKILEMSVQLLLQCHTTKLVSTFQTCACPTSQGAMIAIFGSRSRKDYGNTTMCMNELTQWN
jgi:hypothetical protein